MSLGTDLYQLRIKLPAQYNPYSNVGVATSGTVNICINQKVSSTLVTHDYTNTPNLVLMSSLYFDLQYNGKAEQLLKLLVL